MSGPRQLAGRRVIVLNWRDRSHAEAGGAEVYCHAVAERFVERGAEVYLLTARARGQSRRESDSGIEIRRLGGTFTVYLAVLARLLAWRVFAPERLDLVLDCQNGIPFFSPLVVRRTTAVVGVVFHVHQEQFATRFSAPMARIGRWLEGPASRWVYRRRALAVISPSTRSAVRQRLRLRGPAFVVPCGAEPAPTNRAQRARVPTIVTVGRLVAHKRVDLLIRALPDVVRCHPDLRVDLVGDGPARRELEALTSALDLDRCVRFHGRVGNAERDALTARAWLAVHPSAREGWGLSLIEANASGLPVVCLDVDGLRDAVRPDQTGWIAETVDDLPATVVGALDVLGDPREARRWSRRARAWAARFSWEFTATALGNVMLVESARLATGREQRLRNDLALSVRIDGASMDQLGGGRRTDIWRERAGGLEGLLYGLDESDISRVLARLGLGPATRVGVARPTDLLLAADHPRHLHSYREQREAGDRRALLIPSDRNR